MRKILVTKLLERLVLVKSERGADLVVFPI